VGSDSASHIRFAIDNGAITLSRLSVQAVQTEVELLRLLVVSGPGDLPVGIRDLVSAGKINAVYVDSCGEACNPSLLSNVDAVVVCDFPEPGRSVRETGEIRLLSDALFSHRLSGVVLSSDVPGSTPEDDDAFVFVPEDISEEELWGRLATIQKYRPLLRRIEEQIAVMQQLGNKLNQQFTEVDQELRLASRLQRDFLPKSFPEIGDYRFAALYLPASWVSGDVYDVRRLDESHIGMYLADAVGHGVAAGLLTMFIKQAIVGKRVQDDKYIIIDPGEVLATLNTELAGQHLPHCQFATACYAVIDIESHELSFSRAGHPYPLHVSPNGKCVELQTGGGLLGIFNGEVFPSETVTLKPGEKFIMYSDGLEYTIISQRLREGDEVCFSPEFQETICQPAQECMERLAQLLDQTEGSIQPADDITALVIERLPA